MSVSRVGETCRFRGWSLAVAESCTGGLLGGTLTAAPGSSDYFLGGVIAYADEVKTSLLGVDRRLLDEHGAVSEPAARAMAKGVIEALGADAALAVTGVAGPGASERKPAGTVFIAAVTPERELARRYAFTGGREEVRAQAVEAALALFLEAAGET